MKAPVCVILMFPENGFVHEKKKEKQKDWNQVVSGQILQVLPTALQNLYPEVCTHRIGERAMKCLCTQKVTHKQKYTQQHPILKLETQE